MSHSSFDLVKVSALFAFFCFALYSAVSKFAWLPSGQTQPLKLVTDYSPCDYIKQCTNCANKEHSIRHCEGEVLSAYEKASIFCKRYNSNFQACKKAAKTVKQGQCRVEMLNLESCVHSVTSEVRKKWNGNAPEN